MTVSPSTATPEQVLLLLHSQLSSETLLLLQGLQERGLRPLLARLSTGLHTCALVHHSGLEKRLELERLVHFHMRPGLSLLSAPVPEPDMDLCLPLSSQLSLLPHVHLSTLHLSHSASSELRCRLLLAQLLGLGLNLAERSHSAALLLSPHLGLGLASSGPLGQLPLIHSQCS